MVFSPAQQFCCLSLAMVIGRMVMVHSVTPESPSECLQGHVVKLTGKLEQATYPLAP